MPNRVRYLFSWIDSSLSITSMGRVCDERRTGLMSGVKNGPALSGTTAESPPQFAVIDLYLTSISRCSLSLWPLRILAGHVVEPSYSQLSGLCDLPLEPALQALRAIRHRKAQSFALRPVTL